MGIGKQLAAGGEPIQVGRPGLRMPAHAPDPIIQIVDGDKQNIGPKLGFVQRLLLLECILSGSMEPDAQYTNETPRNLK